jgi:hypothetical protein
MLPSTFTRALRSAIVQICPGGLTVRTVLRFTSGKVPVTLAFPAALETGMTPIPPLNFTRVSLVMAATGAMAARNSAITKSFFMAATPLGRLYNGGCLGSTRSIAR